MNLSIEIEQKARDLGFDLFGITNPSPLDNYSLFEKWLSKRRYGEMNYLDSQHSRSLRKDPGLLFEGGKSIVVVGLAYVFPKESHTNNWNVALFARQPDYHQVIRQRLKDLLQFIRGITNTNSKGLVCCDTAPVLEKELAQRAGLGRIGKNSLLISPEAGSFFNIGELFLNIELPKTEKVEIDPCTDCDLCIQSCPTKCIGSDRTLIADRCISYLTIEHKTLIPLELRSLMDSWIYGCDICQLVCPWNQKFIQKLNPYAGKQSRPEKNNVEIEDNKRFLNEDLSGIQKATMRKRMLRNYAICLGNSHQKQTVAILAQLLNEDDFVIRATAAWALGEIKEVKSKRFLLEQLRREEQNDVRAEIHRALQNFQ